MVFLHFSCLLMGKVGRCQIPVHKEAFSVSCTDSDRYLMYD